MEKLLPKKPKSKKGKSAKYKDIERISRKVFYVIVILIFCIMVTVLCLSIFYKNSEEIEEYTITLVESTFILLFGTISVFSRYKSRLLAYVMMSLSYTVSLLGKYVLEDLCKVASKKCTSSPIEIRVLHLFSICFFIAQTILAYLIRDAQLIADNYVVGRNYQELEQLQNVQKEIMQEAFWKKVRTDKCEECIKNESGEQVYSCCEDNRCLGCGVKVYKVTQVDVIEDWLTVAMLSEKESRINY